MKILHICNDFTGSKVHTNLFRELDKMGIEQTVCTYMRDKQRVGKNSFESERTRFVYRPILNTYHRLLFHLKTHTTFRDLQRQLHVEDYGMVNATTLFSDGAVAYKIYKRYSIPYMVTVRGTDINEFLTLAPHTWPMALRVLRHAKRHQVITYCIQKEVDNYTTEKEKI